MSLDLTGQSLEYRQWLSDLKSRYRQVQLKAAVAVNTALLQFYWDLGVDILVRQESAHWGQGFLAQISADLMQEFPGVAGFSERNLKYIRQWVQFWGAGAEPAAIGQQAVAQLESISWEHNLAIISKCQTRAEAIYYVQQTQAHGWSRAVLTHQIESGLWQREGRAVTNFAHTLPSTQSDLARQDGDAPTISLLLCKSKDRLVAEYALSDIQKPMGLSTYSLSHTLPEALRGKLPSIEQLERELGAGDGVEDGGGV